MILHAPGAEFFLLWFWFSSAWLNISHTYSSHSAKLLCNSALSKITITLNYISFICKLYNFEFKFWGFYNSGCSYCGLLEHKTMQSSMQTILFLCCLTRLHGVTSQNTVIWILDLSQRSLHLAASFSYAFIFTSLGFVITFLWYKVTPAFGERLLFRYQ